MQPWFRLVQRSHGTGTPPPYARRLCGLALLVLGVAVAAPLAAQTGTIRGTVVSAATRQPLAGVQIFVLNTRLGTLTNTQGNFILVTVPIGRAEVRAQLVGYGTAGQAVVVLDGETATANFELAQTAVALDEVVVTGTGVATEKRKLGNTVATIGASAIENKPVTTFSEVLAGREPGVVALPGSGLTGEGASIRIRGTSSLSQSNEPIVYLNGVRIDNGGGRGLLLGAGAGVGGRPSRLDDIDPTTIERVEVLKGAAAATLYGSEASGGVIQIFTKRGAMGEPRWDIQIEQGTLSYPKGAFPLNAGFVTSDTAAARVSQFYGIQLRPFQVFERDFMAPLLERGYTSSYSASVSGGSSAVTYFVSGRYQYEDGPIGMREITSAGDIVRRAQGTANLSVLPAEGVTLRLNAMYTQSENNTVTNNNSIFSPPTLAQFGQPQFAECTTPRRSSNPTGNGGCDGPGNPFGQRAFATVHEAMQRSYEQEAQNFAGSVGVNYRLQDNISLDATFGVNMVNQQDVFIVPFGWDVDGLSTFDLAGARTVSDRNFRQISMDAKGSWDTLLGESLSSQFVLGAQGFIDRMQRPGGFGRDFPGPGFGVAEAAGYQETYETFSSVVNAGFFAQEQLGFHDWVFLTVGGRYDYNSAFGETAGGAFYPKASISIIPTSLPAWGSEAISTLRLRAAVGRAGMQPGAFDKLTTYSSIRTEFGPGLRPWNLGNQDLRPEVSTEWELGSEIGFLNDRLALEGTYWNRTVSDALISRQFPVSGGFLRQQIDNIGQLEAQGVELGIRGQAVQGRNVNINLFANASYLYEKVADLGGAPALKFGGSYTRYRNWMREGYSPGAFFGPKVLDVQYPLDINGNCQPNTREELLTFFSQPRTVSDAQTGGFRVLVQDGDPRSCSSGGDFLGLYLGKPTPDWQGSFGGDVNFLQNFTVSTLFEYKTGNFQVHNLTHGFRRAHGSLGGNLRPAVEARAIMADPGSTAEQRLDAALQWSRLVGLSPYDGLNEVEDADFVRLREVALTYNVPAEFAQRIGARSLAVNLAARNLALWTKYSGTDPEVNVFGRQNNGGLDDLAMGLDAFGMPLARRFSITLRAGF